MLKLKILKFANTIRAVFVYTLWIIFGIVVIKGVRYVGKLYDDKPTVTQILYKPIHRPEPDTKVSGLEKLKQKEVKPLVVHDTVYYSIEHKHLMKTVRADGRIIYVETQYCGDTLGKDFSFPYTPRFQLAMTSEDELHFTEYKDYLDWNKLYFGWSSECGPEAETRLLFKPLHLEGSLKASFKEVEGKILWKVF